MRDVNKQLDDAANSVTDNVVLPAVSNVILPDIADKVAPLARDAVVRVLRSPAFDAKLKQMIQEAALDCAREVLAELLPDLESKVRATISANFDRSVTDAARKILEDKISDIRKRLQ